jgi:hypothetical protein
MEGETDNEFGGELGRTFTTGYLRGLIEAATRED